MPKNPDQQTAKVKIVYIMPTLDQGGAERFLVDLILNLDLNKFAPTLILFKYGGLWLEELKAANISVIVLEKKFKIDLNNFLSILKNLKRIRPLIVHTQLGGDLYGRLAAKIIKIPIIISTEQNVNPDERPLVNLLKIFTGRLADKIVAISTAVKNDLIQRYEVPENKITIIPNGLDLNKFLNFNQEPESSKVKEIELSKPRKIILGTIGRLAPQKGHNVLIEALAKIKDRDFEFLIAGTGPLENKLNKQIEDSRLEHKVKLIGLVNDVPSFLAALDAFVFPSLWEGQGIVLLEAALMNLPIIASEVDGIKDVLSRENAYLVKAGDSDDLAAKISWLLNNLNSETVKARSIKLKEEVINKYSITKIVEDYQKLYQELLNNYENTAS